MKKKKEFENHINNLIKHLHQPVESEKCKTIDFDMTDEDFLLIAKEAHKRDITFNKMFELMTLNFINEYEKNPKEIQKLIKNFNKDKKRNAHITRKKEKRI